MKLRNKKTGEIREIKNILVDEMFTVNSLAELNKEWEDYEEPKEYWYITWDGDVENETDDDTEVDKSCKAIGNYFETREEAEKAVEKLKAWKRLEDKGFKFIDHIDQDNGQGITRYEWDGYVDGEDLDLLFGGEE